MRLYEKKTIFLRFLPQALLRRWPYAPAQKKILAENISILDGGKECKPSENKYIFLEDENFDIRFNS